MTRALVLRAPGINCDRETAHACRLVGFETELVHINHLLRAPERLLAFDFLVIPGGFSYGDDLGAGTLLAKNLTVHFGQQLHQFIDEGRPVLGICNGFQVLVRAGLLPGQIVDSPNIADTKTSTQVCSLTDNASAQFECRWIRLAIHQSSCIFTRDEGQVIELPVAHGEGRFVMVNSQSLARLRSNGQIPLVYTELESMAIRNRDDIDRAIPYPNNPNGSSGNIAGICNVRGNVLGLMPHPERYVNALQHPQHRGRENGEGDGLLIFKNAFEYARQQERIVL
ncbi:MAG TPA: phosphoribosylformylglycinamidine synthase I [Ktedonobacteraceae bacterium]|jgi:phosphoribosylformylglycinamidine synthase I|nr:phosphoribosylformylglycinamidine synthase I [Ktedonobacteraceae bacterium]